MYRHDEKDAAGHAEGKKTPSIPRLPLTSCRPTIHAQAGWQMHLLIEVFLLADSYR